MPRLTALIGALLAGLLVASCGGASDVPEGTGNTAGIGRYVALGDSYTAAPGVPDQTGPFSCFRSDHNYPSLVAQTLHVGEFVDRSCGGATTADLAKAQASGIPPQLDPLTATTDLVTVGIGGNDLGVFGVLVGYCVTAGQEHPHGSPCTDAARKDPEGLQQVFGTIRSNVTKALRDISARSPSATIVAVGYPQLIPAHGTCAAMPLAPADYPLARRVNKGLDDAVGAAARAAGVSFVDLWKVSAGHDICARHPWINGSHLVPGKAVAFHPFGVEQQAVARLVVRAVRHPASPSPAS